MADNTPSWPSAFWSVLGIALNTMLQPSGNILGFDSKYDFALRCSPVVCGGSAVDSIVRLVLYSLETGSFRTGLDRWVALRFEGNEADSSFLSMRKNNTYILIAFVVGAYCLIIKILATRGIPGTQTACTLYPASFCVDEIIIMIAPKNSDESQVETEDKTCKILILFAQAAFHSSCKVGSVWAWCLRLKGCCPYSLFHPH